jgi:hypothetical protein
VRESSELKVARENAEHKVAIMKAAENMLDMGENSAKASGDEVLIEQGKQMRKVFAEKAYEDFLNIFK